MNKEELIALEQDIANTFNNGGIKAPVHLYSGNEEEMINMITKLKENKKFSLKQSKKSHVLLSKYDWKRSLSLYNKII